MPQLLLEVTDAQWQRIKAAFTHDVNGVPTPPTAAYMRAWIFDKVKAVVVAYEKAKLEALKSEAITQIEAAKWSELTNEGW